MVDVKKTLLKEAKAKAKKAVDFKISQVEKQLELDLQIMEDLINLVSQKVLYKIQNHNYVLVTKEILFEDFQQEPKWASDKGIKIENKDNYDKTELYVKVNGVWYYHIGKLIQKYRKKINGSIKRSQWDLDKLREQRDELKELEKMQPQILKLFKEFQETYKVEVDND